MGIAQNSMLGLLGTAGVAASKVSGSLASGNEGGNLDATSKSLQAEMSANKGLLDEYTRERGNLMKTKPMLEKIGRWTPQHEERLKNIDERIQLYQEADSMFTQRYRDTLNKMGGEK